jgi:pimeloyl-ACP methyl ester carboxylesterase
MTESVEIQYQEWGEGPPVLALHGLGLESSSFTGLARGVTDLGLRMLAADLPGFGKTPAPDRGLTPAVLAESVLDLARRLETKPLVMGMSLGARVALEAALTEPDLFRGLVLMSVPLPRRESRWMFPFARLLSPEIAMRVPVDWAWPGLKWLADRLEDGLEGGAEHDWFLRASRRTIYYISCPATRWAFVSAARELALDPAEGPESVWERLESLSLPTAFVWGDQDQFIWTKGVPLAAERVPHAFQIHVPCAGHFDNGPHFRCLEEGALEGIRRVESAARSARRSRRRREAPRTAACRVVAEESEATPDSTAATAGGRTR